LPSGNDGASLRAVNSKLASWQEVARKLRSLVKRGEQRKLAIQLGITPAALSRYLNGERVPSDPVLALRLCSLLGVDLAEVLEGGKVQSKKSSALSGPLRRLADRLSTISRDANDLVAKVESERNETDRSEGLEEDVTRERPESRTRKR
jgi:transcriptional regulator with XRE-family HTH domain